MEGCSIANLAIEGSVETLIEQQENLIGAGEKLLKLNNLKGKLSNKVSKTFFVELFSLETRLFLNLFDFFLYVAIRVAKI